MRAPRELHFARAHKYEGGALCACSLGLLIWLLIEEVCVNIRSSSGQGESVVMGANLSYPAVSLSGKVALVTGANTGIGYETAKAFAGMGAHTFITCRSREKADRVRTPLRLPVDRTYCRPLQCVDRMKAELAEEREGAEVKVEGLELELGSFRSTRDCADAFKAKNLPLHLLVNNAGVLTQQLCE